MATPNYTTDLTMAYQETHVFKFAQKTITRFTCQIRICYKGKDCTELSPPRACPTLEERLAAVRKLRDQPAVGRKDIYSSLIDIEKELQRQTPKTTSPRPLVNFTAQTKGRIYFDGNSSLPKQQRLRRALDIDGGQGRLVRSEQGYPRMDVTGELRVLDSREDARYYEEHGVTDGAPEKCSQSTTLLWIWLGSLIASSILLIILIFTIARKTLRFSSKETWIPN
ncbi:unnamed protein product, partial [Mesorhabditis spiculigera]